MTLKPSAFGNDVLTLSAWDLLRLLFRRRLRVGSLEVHVE